MPPHYTFIPFPYRNPVVRIHTERPLPRRADIKKMHKNKMNKSPTSLSFIAVSCLALPATIALGAGPLQVGGSLPYNGDGAGGFTIDHAAFDRNDVTSAPCPVGATCTNMTATSSDENFLMREVTVPTFGYRYIQTIFVESDPVNGDFIYEAMVTPESQTLLGDPVDDNIGSKQVIDVADTGEGSFFASHEFYRGYEHFDNGNTGPSMVMLQIVDGFQTFTYDGLLPGAENAVPASTFRMGIHQDGAGNMPNFVHVVTRGAYSPPPGVTLEIGDQVITLGPLRDSLAATWIGVSMSGGGPGLAALAPGQTQNHDTRTADQRDFGLLIYRNYKATAPTGGNAGGTPNGLVNPQFTQNINPSLIEIRGFSLQHDQNDSGIPTNLGHGSFVGGADLLADYWDTAVFGPNPY